MASQIARDGVPTSQNSTFHQIAPTGPWVRGMPHDYQAVDMVEGRDLRNMLTIIHLGLDGLLYYIA
jgi:hypothetical protein